jgi:hypothetical protein
LSSPSSGACTLPRRHVNLALLSSCRIIDKLRMLYFLSRDWRCVQNLTKPASLTSHSFLDSWLVSPPRAASRHSRSTLPSTKQSRTYPCVQWCIWQQWEYCSRPSPLYIYRLVQAAQHTASPTIQLLSRNQSPVPTNVGSMQVSISVSKTTVRCAGSHLEHIIAQLVVYAGSVSIITVPGYATSSIQRFSVTN